MAERWKAWQLARNRQQDGGHQDELGQDWIMPENDDYATAAVVADKVAATELQAVDKCGRRVLIVFADAPEKWLLRWLPKAFRHCFAVLETSEAGCWIYLNPASHRLECTLWRFSSLFDPAAHYRARGHKCLWVTVPSDNLPRLRLGLASCVGVMKHLLGISAWWVVTPRGLHRYLMSRSKIYQKSS
ncbi:hypothetical protein LF95_03480 [Thalassospira sp. TSL5-1]|nr:hypothetical protein LF95_03480 [Thalassospira sp. TSL5-1]